MDKHFAVINLVLDSGERLPCLVDAQTWVPVRLATRWVIRHRRYRVQASTLASNLRAIAKLYEWAAEVKGFDLDDYLTSGQLIDSRQLESVAAYLRGAPPMLKSNTFNIQVYTIGEFLKWAVLVENRGGVTFLSLDQAILEIARLEYTIQSLTVPGNHSQRIKPLTDDEVETIRAAIAPQKDVNQKWVFPESGFSKQTALRNWLMFEVTLQLGLRRGELLKLRLDSLPRGASDGIKVLRHPGDSHDSRTIEPAVKTAERIIPASRNLLSSIRAYITTPPPIGRPKVRTPYLFLARSGNPVSLDTSNDIIKAIGEHSNIEGLSWHRLRHAWAEKMAEVLSDLPNGFDRLMYLGGWTSPSSPKHYIQDVIAKQANQSMKEYQDDLYEEAWPYGN